MQTIAFNKPYITGKETEYIRQALASGKISGAGPFTEKCHRFFENKYGFKKALLTTSCTDALEMAALLADIRPGDEVIAPSYAFVSTVNAFVLRGAKIIFCDSSPQDPNIDADEIEKLINPGTKVIVVVHYAGIACDMGRIMRLAEKHNLLVVEDAAQAIDSYYNGKPLGSIGHLAAFSFHETKNITSGEGGMLVINDDRFVSRSEILWQNGTNRNAFLRGEVDKYGWVDTGSSFLPSDSIAAFLYAQLESLEEIQEKRKKIWSRYREGLRPLEEKKAVRLPYIPAFASNNAHMFYILLNENPEREALLAYLKDHGINGAFHYQPLHKSIFYRPKHGERELPRSCYYADCLIRLPFYFELTDGQIDFICGKVTDFFGGRI